MFREKLTAIQWGAIVVCFVGVVLLTVFSGGLTMNSGLIWLMGLTPNDTVCIRKRWETKGSEVARFSAFLKDRFSVAV